MRSKFDNDWNCPECGELQSKHSMCLGIECLCDKCFTQTLTQEEDKYISTLRNNFKFDNGLQNISGAFCNVIPILFDRFCINCIVEIGSCDEGGSYKNSFEIEIDRETLTLIKN